MRSFVLPVVGYALIWAAALAYWVLVAGESPVEPLFVLGIFGIGFPVVTYVLLAGTVPLETQPATSWLEPVMLLVLFGAVAAYLVDGPGYVSGLAEAYAPGSETMQLWAKLGGKLAVFVVLPYVLMCLVIRHKLWSFGWHLPIWKMLRLRHVLLFVVLGGALCAFQYYLSSDAAPLREGEFTQDQLIKGLPIVFAWLFIEVGLVEEFFFRGVIQSRLAAFLRNEWAAMFIASLLFALAHVPGLVLRGDEIADPLMTTVNAILILSAASLTFGFIWMRTRNLLILMALHAVADVLPNYAELSATFGLS